MPLILDGYVDKRHLKIIGKDEEWLVRELLINGYPNIRDIFTAAMKTESGLSNYEREKIERRYWKSVKRICLVRNSRSNTIPIVIEQLMISGNPAAMTGCTNDVRIKIP